MERRARSKRVEITLPFPSQDDVAKLIGVPSKRARQIAELVSDEPQAIRVSSSRIGALRKVRRRLTPRDNQGADSFGAFLNVPYDQLFEDLYLAYVVGLTSFGLIPRAALEFEGHTRRLDRIKDLIQECQYSFHDLSRVELDFTRPRTPRFNMPFELGLAAMTSLHPGSNHSWFVLETKHWRLQKSLSDLNGTDIYIHGGKPRGVFRELCNALVRDDHQPTVPQMEAVYRRLKTHVPSILRASGSRSPFGARAFSDLRIAAQTLASASRLGIFKHFRNSP
jgi:hypothetical protein